MDQPANTLRIQFVRDKSKERLCSGTLTVSSAADAPRDKLDENRKAVADFLQTFAPGLKAGADVLAADEQWRLSTRISGYLLRRQDM